MHTIIGTVFIFIIVQIWLHRKTISDGKALWWSTVSEPLHYVSNDPFDDGVISRAENARSKLKAHGNRYLKDEDVWTYVYSATPQTTTRDFSQWQDWAQLDLLKRRAEWRQQKATWNTQAAAKQFAGQTIEL